jgi:hypothetical protein
LSSETSLATCSSSSWENDAAGCITLRSPAICGSEAWALDSKYKSH